jgi:hypothetical protein
MALGLGPVVRLVNRVIDEKGERVPQNVTYSGEALVVKDTLDVPVGAARVLIHQSMYKVDPVSGTPSYRLGCSALGCPVDDIPKQEAYRQELIDRELMTESERKKMKMVRIHNPINPGLSRGPGGIRQDAEGAQPGEFGYRG